MENPIENPYESPTVDATMAIPTKKTSGWLMAIGITAIVLGSLGILTGLFGVARLAMGSNVKVKMAQQRAFGVPPEQMEIQQEMQQEIENITHRWTPITGPLLGLGVIVSGCLIAGAIGTLRLRPRGRTFLVGVFWVAIIVEVVQLIPTIAMQCEMAGVTERIMPRLMNASAPPGQAMPEGFGDTMATFTKVGMILGIAFVLILNTAEAGFYLFGAIYLGRESVRERFTPPEDAVLVQSG